MNNIKCFIDNINQKNDFVMVYMINKHVVTMTRDLQLLDIVYSHRNQLKYGSLDIFHHLEHIDDRKRIWTNLNF